MTIRLQQALAPLSCLATISVSGAAASARPLAWDKTDMVKLIRLESRLQRTFQLTLPIRDRARFYRIERWDGRVVISGVYLDVATPRVDYQLVERGQPKPRHPRRGLFLLPDRVSLRLPASTLDVYPPPYVTVTVDRVTFKVLSTSLGERG